MSDWCFVEYKGVCCLQGGLLSHVFVSSKFEDV
jgi:hypothetical protein